MRVIAGEYGGRRLAAPPGEVTRPTSDRVREALFSILGGVEGLRVLDLYAGTGALGIEALSRGAASATFVETDRCAGDAIEANLAALGAQGDLRRVDALSFLGSVRGNPFDLVFVDPPYDAAPRLGADLTRLLPTPATIVTESDKRNPLSLDLPLADERTYGTTRIAIHHAR
jgi:16S rRNA (guanine966-N2)-methyltransferase